MSQVTSSHLVPNGSGDFLCLALSLVTRFNLFEDVFIGWSDGFGLASASIPGVAVSVVVPDHVVPLKKVTGCVLRYGRVDWLGSVVLGRYSLVVVVASERVQFSRV